MMECEVKGKFSEHRGDGNAKERSIDNHNHGTGCWGFQREKGKPTGIQTKGNREEGRLEAFKTPAYQTP